MKYAIVTFGCRVNQADSLRIEGDLRERGAQAASIEDADAVFVNTCSVTASADQGGRQAIRRAARANPRARIIVTGCYATRRPDEIASLPSVARIIPNADKDRLVALMADDMGLTTAERFGGGDGACGMPLEPGVAGRTALTLRVQTGCDEPCAYCIIPSTRGGGRSLPMAAVIQEVERAAAAGFKEIAITGVHLGSYGRDLVPPATLGSLLSHLARTRGDVTFRISSLEPMDCTQEVVKLVASSDRFAPHFHLPLQHGSNAVLRRMRRPYTLSAYSRLVDAIRVNLPHASIGSDVIVGFPGETDDDRGLPGILAADAPARLSVLGSSGDGGGVDAGQSSRCGDSSTCRADPRHRPHAERRLSRRAGRHDPSGPHPRGRDARGYR